MWARLDDVCNTSLQRSVHAADRLAKWSAAALVGPCSSLDEFVREALRRMRAIWSAAALKIGGMLRDATLAFHEQFSRYEARVKAGGAQSPTAADGGGGGRPRSAQATLAALLFATGKQVMSFLCSGLERILSGLQAVRGALGAAAAAVASASTAPFVASAAEGVRSLQATTREAFLWERGDVYEEVERLLQLGIARDAIQQPVSRPRPRGATRRSRP